jgi:hypothetical protein
MGQVLDLGACIAHPESCKDGVVDGSIYDMPTKNTPTTSDTPVPSAVPEPAGAQLLADVVPYVLFFAMNKVIIGAYLFKMKKFQTRSYWRHSHSSSSKQPAIGLLLY